MSSLFHVEVIQKRQSGATKDEIKQMMQNYLTNLVSLVPGLKISNHDLEENGELKEHVFSITYCDIEHKSEVSITDTDIVCHIYKLDSFGIQTDKMTDAATGEEVSFADVWELPSEEFYGLWENLMYDSNLKEDTLRFIETAMEFTRGGLASGVEFNAIGLNRVVLLHGLPGTGKTSLCRALAQKLAVRLNDRFPRARLLEINAHGLFYKWSSESERLLAKLFKRIREIMEDKHLLVCVLIDAVESLASLKSSDTSGGVNVILTELDRLERYPNAVILTTSNLIDVIDIAFIHRVSIKQHLVPPSQRVAYEILCGCCSELMSRGLVAPRDQLLGVRVLEAARFKRTEESRVSLLLWGVACAAAAQRLSGRALRRLPILARAQHTQADCNLLQFIEALHAALYRYLADAADFYNGSI